MTWWAVSLATFAVLLLVGIPLWGAHKFNPSRAKGVKYAEQSAVVQQRVVELAVVHPEIVKEKRFDRHPFYVAPHVGVFLYAVCIFAGATPTNNVASLSGLTRFTMASCFIVGSSFVLAGTLLGAPIGRWRIAPRVHDHPTAPVLGDDVTLPYWLGCAGLACVTVSMAIYSLTSFQTTTGSLGGWLTATLAGASAAGFVHLYLGVRDFTRTEAMLIAEAMARGDRDVPD